MIHTNLFQRKIFATLVMCAAAAFTLHAQESDCAKIHYTANAGGNIEVCKGGTIKLDGVIGDDATRGVWRGGKGTFAPNRETLNAEYTPSEDELEGPGVTLILVADNPKYTCEKVRSQMHIMVRDNIKADAGADFHVCPGSTVQLNGSVKGGKSKNITWITNGTGKFSDAHILKPVYLPSQQDLALGALSLQMNVEPFGLCLDDSDAVIVMFEKAPEYSLSTEKFIKAGETASVAIRSNSKIEGTFSWSTSGSGTFSAMEGEQTVYTPSAEDIKKETVILSVMLKYGTSKCEAKKVMTLHVKK